MGCCLTFPTPSAPPPRDLADRFEPDQDTLDVFLSIPHYREQGVNVASSGMEMETRFRAEVDMVRDENTGQSGRPVMVARKNFRLVFETESREGSSALRVATIRRLRRGRTELEPRFVAPLLNIGASEYLISMARPPVEILLAKNNSLSATRRQKNQSLANSPLRRLPALLCTRSIIHFRCSGTFTKRAGAIPRRFFPPC